MINYLSEKLKVRKWLIYVLIMVLIFFLFNLIIKKEMLYINNINNQISLLEKELNLIEKNIGGIDTQEIAKIEVDINKLKSDLNLGLESQLVLLEINKYAEKAGLDIIGFNSQDIVKSNDLKYRGYNLIINGDYEKFIHWLSLMENLPYYVNVEKLYIGKIKLNRENLMDGNFEQETIYIVTINNVALDVDNGIGKGI